MNMKQNILKLKILMIVLLLSCLRGYAQTIPSTGEITYTDTTCVSIPIEYIRLANQRLIERNYLLDVNAYKDSIIVDYKNYIKEYEKLTIEAKDRLNEMDRVNKNLSKSLNRQKKVSLVLGCVAGTSLISLVLVSLIN